MIYVIIGILVVLLVVGLAVATYSSSQLVETFEKYNRVPCYKKTTGGQFALELTNNLFGGRIAVGRTKGYLNDGYSSKSKMVVLSETTCDSSSVAALTIVAHEFGHASQDLSGLRKFKANKFFSKLTKVLGYLMFPLAIVGLFLCLIMSENLVIGFSLLGVAFAILVLCIVVKLALIPLEKDASKRGIDLLIKTEALYGEELDMAKDLLKAALLTYVGDFLRSILWWTFLTKRTKYF